MKRKLLLLAAGLSILFQLQAQEDQLVITGNVQLDAQTYREDSIIGAEAAPEKLLSNFYSNFLVSYKNFYGGVRFEGYLNQMQGFLPLNEGVGVPYYFAGFQKDNIDITVGSFYEQFGSGLILRTYEEKTLGYDNAFQGIRIRLNVGYGLTLKAVYGQQRLAQLYVNDRASLVLGKGIVRGIDAELNLNEAIRALNNSSTYITLGASFVSKYEPDNNPVYKLPANVAAGGGRIDVTTGKYSFMAEYTYRAPDPSAAGLDNSNGNVGQNFIYRPGQGFVASASYSTRGLGVYVAAKSIDNMNFRSDRNAKINDLLINFIPDFTRNYTYLIAAMYPYATQLNGEAGYQAAIQYNIPKKTFWGGRYGTDLRFEYSRMFSLMKNPLDSIPLTANSGTEGYDASLIGFGNDLFYQDISLAMERKFNRKVKTLLMVQHLTYDNNILHGAGEYNGVIEAFNVIGDVYYRFTNTKTLRTEVQHMVTEGDKGNWGSLLFEYTLPGWFFIVGDLYNYGNPNVEERVHYYTFAIAYAHGGNRIQVGYGKQREGVVCTGGICRRVPASHGFNISLTSTF